MVSNRNRETSGVPASIAVLGLLAFSVYLTKRWWFGEGLVVGLVVTGVIFAVSLVWYFRRRR